MYSAVPLKERRIAFLKRVGHHLKEGGLFYMEFKSGISPSELRHYPLKKFLAGLLGNRFYELGDSLFAGWHYQHAFVNEGDLRQEIATSGLKVVTLSFEGEHAILRGG